jgi:hypothetical protein
MKLTRPVEIAASQLIASVGQTFRWGVRALTTKPVADE